MTNIYSPKILFIVIFSLLFFVKANAQDTIALKSGQKIIAPIDEVGDTYIIYKKRDNTGTLQTKKVLITDIRRVNYKNGYVERYDKDEPTNVQKKAPNKAAVNETGGKDQIQLVNGKILPYKVVEIHDKNVTVRAGEGDSIIQISHVASITYANGYKEKYNDVVLSAKTKVRASTSVAAIPAPVPVGGPVILPIGDVKLTKAQQKEQDRLAKENAKAEKALTGKQKPDRNNKKSKIAQNKEIITVPDKDKITLGIGYVIDSVSKISNQYYLYDLLAQNTITTKDKMKVLPVLTFRSGLCDYFLNGTIATPVSKFELWQKGEMKGQFLFSTPENFVYNDLLKALYIKLSSVLAAKELTFKTLKLTMPEIPAIDFTSTKTIKYDLLLNASNYNPPLDDYASISREYLKPVADIDTVTLSKLFSPAFVKLSPKAKNRNPSYVRYSAALDEYVKILPQFPVPSIPPKKYKIPVYWIENDIKENISHGETVKYLEALYPIYTSTKLKEFLFESSMVDDKIKEAAKHAVFPLYKRPGTVLTYLQCGKDFIKMGAFDAAVESFSSGLLMVDNLNTTGTFKEFLKSSLFDGMSAALEANNQVASAIIAKNLSELHKILYNSDTFDADNKGMYDATQKLSEYFEKVETDALDARKKKRAATWTGILNAVGTVASAYNDAAAGYSVSSDQTLAFADNTSQSLADASDIKQASINASAEAAEVFNQSFDQLMSQMHNDNANLDGARPLFAMDFIELISDKYSMNVIGNSINNFLNLIPAVQPMVNQYLTDTSAGNQSSVTINDIYLKFGTMELSIVGAEGSGKATSERDLTDFQ